MVAYLFDIDGVLTDPVEKRVTHPILVTMLAELLKKGNILGFNTGRSVEWAQERLIDFIVSHIPDKKMLGKMIVIGEKGEVWKVWAEEGREKLLITEGLSMPKHLREQVKRIIEDKYSEAIMLGEPKHTMISSEMKDGFDLKLFPKYQKPFIEELKKLLQKEDVDKQYEVTFDTIGVNIEHHHVGKALGTKRFLTFLKERAIHPKQFKTFGDAKSDLEMADTLFHQEKKVTFVFTGKKAKLRAVDTDYPIVFAEGYSQGTLEYLQKEEKAAFGNSHS